MVEFMKKIMNINMAGVKLILVKSYQIKKTELPGSILSEGSSVLRRLRMTHSAYLSRKGKYKIFLWRLKLKKNNFLEKKLKWDDDG